MVAEELFKKIIQGDRRALAKAITLTESTKPEDRVVADKLMQLVFPKSGNSQRIGISGIPGVGKSSFIEVLGKELIKNGDKVAVLAVDPTSPISGGSILGDKTRMEELSQDLNAFIRPSPTSGSLGGVAQKTRETIFLCEAAGFNKIIVETVGVGQSEYEVSSMVDLFIVLMVPNAGDELQGIKKGIIELADILIVNKADGDTKILAENAKTQYENALHIIKKDNPWSTKVLTCSSLEKKGFTEIIDSTNDFFELLEKGNSIEQKRKDQNLAWMTTLFNNKIHDYISEKSSLKKEISDIKGEVAFSRLTPHEGAQKMFKLLIKD